MSAAQRAAVVAIGDELLVGAYPDRNAAAIARAIRPFGRHAERFVVVGDDEETIAATIRDLAREGGVVFTTGGLGPTLDDVSRHAAARAAGVPLVRSDEALRHLAAWWERLGREMPESNERQALVPEGATLIPNERGTAPGFQVRVGDAEAFVLPGPPNEMAGMLEGYVLPWLAEHPIAGVTRATRSFHLFGLSESVFADRAGDWMERGANPLMGVTFRAGVLSVRIESGGVSEDEATLLLEERVAVFRARFQEHIFSEEEADLAFVTGKRLIGLGLPFAVAESCTGGLVLERLTRVPGISAVLQEGFVVYSNEAKTARLGVSAELIERFGAVSEEVARAMARGAAERAGVELAVSVTGVAGPGGGTPEKPVGLVYFGGCGRGFERVVERRFPAAGRDRIREWAATTAIALLGEAAGT